MLYTDCFCLILCYTKEE